MGGGGKQIFSNQSSPFPCNVPRVAFTSQVRSRVLEPRLDFSFRRLLEVTPLGPRCRSFFYVSHCQMILASDAPSSLNRSRPFLSPNCWVVQISHGILLPIHPPPAVPNPERDSNESQLQKSPTDSMRRPRAPPEHPRQTKRVYPTPTENP